MAALARAFEGMGVDDDTAVETTRTLCRAETMYCFKVPPRGPQGYSAKLLKEHPAGSYTLEIVAKGREAVILLKQRAPPHKTFCMSPIVPGGADCYEKAFDSSRYFVLRIEDARTKKTASIGIGFNEREQALNFKVSVQDFLEGVKREQVNAQAVATHVDTGNFALAEGTTIKVNLKKKKKKKDKKEKKKKKDQDGGGAGSSISLSAPPPSGGGRSRRRRGGNGGAAAATANSAPGAAAAAGGMNSFDALF
jgi:hypothetical protein